MTTRYSGKEFLRTVPEELVRIVNSVWFDRPTVAREPLWGRPMTDVRAGRDSNTESKLVGYGEHRWRPDQPGQFPALESGQPGGHGSQ